eukprot:CAMPEP_0184993464 /NCGR_PEP_ID=MMETSP1098-20130426/45667_1 /TAXON_ID=89044 /ORGANISM="Spumella elongata, Strain CCAP 955/1" /LENGTH=194 /DNA_ID=CAMNT_0027519303 /DNA_START=97 /DNA_END=681 /DNA_ORIENTATION=+
MAVALQPGDRVSMLTQTFHSDTKTEWLDMPLHLMPRFTTPGSHIFHVTIPKFAKNATEYRINPRNDLKVSFTFLGNKLSLPNIQVYNAKERVALKKLVVTFTHDEFEVVKVDIEKIYGNKMTKVDPSHPTLRGFELQYQWTSVQEEDFGLGVIVMFCSAIVAFLVLFSVIVCNSELMDVPPTPAASRARKNRMN